MKILILSLTSIGNTILFIPTLRLLHQQFPDARVDVVVRHEASKEILERLRCSRHIYVCNQDTHPVLSNKLVFAHTLRRQKYDTTITPFPSNCKTANLLSFLVGAKRRIASRYQVGFAETLGFLQTEYVDINELYHNVKQNLSLLTCLGIDVSHAEENISWDLTEEEKAAAETWTHQNHLTSEKLFIGFHPGGHPTEGHIYKRWPARYFATLGDKLAEQFHARILLFGGPEEAILKKDIAAYMRQQPLLPEINSLGHTAALIKKCTIFVANDTSLMHTATAMNVPTVGLFGPTDPACNAPYGRGHLVVRSDMSCMPCHKFPYYQYSSPAVQCQYGNGQKGLCMQRLSVEKVYDVIVRNHALLLNSVRA